jgi:hypothetical protein
MKVNGQPWCARPGPDRCAGWLAVDDRGPSIEQHLKSMNTAIGRKWSYKKCIKHDRIQSGGGLLFQPAWIVASPNLVGRSPDRESRFAYMIAPRGAAQSVYQRQFVMQIDPALLEQIGPRQYRLRVFPIQPMRLDYTETGFSRVVIEDSAPLYVWMTYQVMAEEVMAMPHLAEKRNVYWTPDNSHLEWAADPSVG